MRRRVPTTVLSGAMLSLLLVGCDPSAPSPVDQPYQAPALRSLLLSFTTVDTDSLFVGPDRLPEDVLTISVPATVDAVRYSGSVQLKANVEDATGDSFSSTSSFHDDGLAPDVTANDGTFAGIVSFDVERSKTGLYAIHVGISDQTGLSGNTVTQTVNIIRSNLPPIISNLLADTLVSQSGGNTTLQIRLTASDPNGQADVKRVWFDAYRPDQSPSSGNPFIMLDDGNAGGISGDVTAGDGIYGLTVAFQGASVGTYRFSFRATDRSLDTSNVIDHFLTVVP